MTTPIPPPAPVITGQTLDFTKTPQTDPEGETAVRQFTTTAPAGPQAAGGGAAGQAGQTGSIPAIFEYRANVLDLAQAESSKCISCRHWDHKAFLAFVARSTGPLSSAEDRQTIETYKAKIKIDNLGRVGDTVEQTLTRDIGLCHVLSDWVEGVAGKNPIYWPFTPMRDATCPTYVAAVSQSGDPARMELVTPMQPHGLFKPRDLDAKKINAGRYDAILYDAAGRAR